MVEPLHTPLGYNGAIIGTHDGIILLDSMRLRHFVLCHLRREVCYSIRADGEMETPNLYSIVHLATFALSEGVKCYLLP